MLSSLLNAAFDSSLACITFVVILLQICSGTRCGVLDVLYYICPVDLLARSTKVSEVLLTVVNVAKDPAEKLNM